MERTIQYLQEKMAQFLRKGDPVLICFEDDGGLGSLFFDAAQRCNAKPQFLGEDRRWMTLLRQAFDCRTGTIIAPPLVILGLSKLARAKGTPLYIRNVVTAGYPCTDWMIEGIRNGLDCKSWGCFDVAHEAIVGGFSCPAGWGVHINSKEFDVQILDEEGTEVSFGEMGAVVLRSCRDGSTVPTCDRARFARCSCGSQEPLIKDIALGPHLDHELLALSNSINQWTSVLDCRLVRTMAGLEIEIVVFPGEKLPKLPSCAKLVVRPWNPEKDQPFLTTVSWKNPGFVWESH